jgi:hypothetical protein
MNNIESVLSGFLYYKLGSYKILPLNCVCFRCVRISCYVPLRPRSLLLRIHGDSALRIGEPLRGLTEAKLQLS